MRISIGCEFEWESPGATPTIWQVRPRPDGPHRVVTERWRAPSPLISYVDAFGNACERLLLPEGQSTVRYEAHVEVPDARDEADEKAAQVPIEILPEDTLVFLLPSRLCWPEVLYDEAWKLFGGSAPGWPRVQAVSDWVHANVAYKIGSSNSLTTANDVWESHEGVCRDFTHLGITLCRSLNIPARYVAGYLPDIDTDPPDLPMDFCSWLEVWLGDRWWTFDPRNNERRAGRVVIARGRDAVDAAMVTTYGAAELKTMTVWADEVAGGD